MLSMPLIVTGVAMFGYFAFKKLTFSYDYCGSYGEFDDELGWRLKANASSCMSLRNYLKGIVYFDTQIYTNSGGFRDVRPGGSVPQRAIMTIGDSWTFGYGVNYEETYPHFMAQTLGVPVINSGIPGYGSGSNALLLARTAKQYRPSIVVYHTLGMHTRSLCTKQEAVATLLPCYAYDPNSKQVALVKPKPGAVAEAVRNHIYPGNSLTAGYNSLYWFILRVKIPEALNKIGTAVNSLLGKNASLATAFAPDHEAQALELELRQYLALANTHGFAFVLADTENSYERAFDAIAGGFVNGAIRIGAREWREQVRGKILTLPADEQQVPMDGHYSKRSNQIVGNYLATIIRDRLADRLRDIKN